MLLSEFEQKLVDDYQQVDGIPIIDEAWISPTIDQDIYILCVQNDSIHNRRHKFLQCFQKRSSAQNDYISMPFGLSVSNVIKMLPSPSWKYLALFRSLNESNGPMDQYSIEIFSQGQIKLIVHTQGKHGQIFTDEAFSAFSWSPDEEYLTYTAQYPVHSTTSTTSWCCPSQPPSPACSISSDSTRNSEPIGMDSLNEQDKTMPQDKFQYQETWGEGNILGDPTIFILSIAKKELLSIDSFPSGISPGQIQWVPGKTMQFICTGWEQGHHRLGILYCFNRPSSFYLVKIPFEKWIASKKVVNKSSQMDKDLVNIQELKCQYSLVRSPRFSPDGQTLVFLSAAHAQTHHSSSILLKTTWPIETDTLYNFEAEGMKSGKEKTLTFKAERILPNFLWVPSQPYPFPGFFINQLNHQPFITSHLLLVSTIWHSSVETMSIDIQNHQAKIISLPSETSPCNWMCSLVDTLFDQMALFQVQLPVQPPQLVLLDLAVLKPTSDASSADERWLSIYHPRQGKTRFPTAGEFEKQLAVESTFIHRIPVKETTVKEQRSQHIVEAICLMPKAASSDMRKTKSIPLVLYPHGGPHSVSLCQFSLVHHFLATLGYAILLVNYRGSLGFGQEVMETILGHVGTNDVNDCLKALDHIISSYEYFSHQNIYLMGGSHGGFIVGHLVSQHAQRKWKAAVMMNPVTNVPFLITSTDIPDFCYTESQVHTLQDQGLQKMFQLSPISFVSGADTPILLVLGKKDRRVPWQQGLEFHLALKKKGIPTRCLVYPKSGHSINQIEYITDWLINSARWFNQYQ